MNSLSYLSRQFDVVLASSSAPNSPPSTPTDENGPADAVPPLKRIRTWASARSFFLPQTHEQPQHRYLQQQQSSMRLRKRSGSTPNSSRFQLTTFSSSAKASRGGSPATPAASNEPTAAPAQPHTSSMPTVQTKSLLREAHWLQRVFYIRVLLILVNWLSAVWDGLTSPLRHGSAKGKGVERAQTIAEADATGAGKEGHSDAYAMSSRLGMNPSRTSYVRARASSIMKIVLQPQNKPPTPSPLSQSNLASLPTVNLVPPDPSEDDDNSDRSTSTSNLSSPSTSTLSPQTLSRSRVAQTPNSRTSSAKTTPLHTRKTLVLDLDETLIHSTTRPLHPSSSGGMFNFGGLVGFRHDRRAGHMVEVVMGGRSTLYHVYKRPFVDYFLRKVSTWYTLVIFTASMKEYADPVIDWLDAGRGILPLRFFREQCTQLPNGSYSKDLSILNEDLARVCLIDNSPISYSINKANGIPIEGWTHDPNDEALLDLLPVLDSLRFTSDVRHVLGLRGF